MIYIIYTLVDDETDREFLIDVYDKYEGFIIGTAYKYLNDKHSAEDVAQDVIIKLIGKMKLIKTMRETELAVYIAKTVKTTSLDLIRKRKHESFDETVIDNETDHGETAIEKIIAVDDRQDLLDSMEYLSDKEKDLLYLKFYLSASDAEIAKKIGVGKESVRVLIKRAKEKLKAHMSELSRS